MRAARSCRQSRPPAVRQRRSGSRSGPCACMPASLSTRSRPPPGGGGERSAARREAHAAERCAGVRARAARACRWRRRASRRGGSAHGSRCRRRWRRAPSARAAPRQGDSARRLPRSGAGARPSARCCERTTFSCSVPGSSAWPSIAASNSCQRIQPLRLGGERRAGAAAELGTARTERRRDRPPRRAAWTGSTRCGAARLPDGGARRLQLGQRVGSSGSSGAVIEPVVAGGATASAGALVARRRVVRSCGRVRRAAARAWPLRRWRDSAR